ncbi:type II secretion system F family protein [soil metagenome]
MEMTPNGLLILTAGACAALLLAALCRFVMDRRARLARVRSAVAGRSAEAGRLRASSRQSWKQGTLGLMRASTRRFSIMKDRQIGETRRLLVSAGYRGRDAIVVFSFFKLVAPLVFLAAGALYVYGLDPIGRGPLFDLAAVVAAALIGSKLPDILVRNKRAKWLDSIRKTLPDSLDMLVICAEAGLASDAALKRVVAETGKRSGVLAEELHQTALELSFMPERRVALDNLAERALLPSVAAFTNTLIQAERYGTPLARAFKVLSQEQRAERMLRAEEKAGRLPATMTVPMMAFILPALFIVLTGPAALEILGNFIGME